MGPMPTRTLVQELWSPKECQAAEALCQAVTADDLAQALLALDGADEPTATACLTRLNAWGRALDVVPDDDPHEQAHSLAELLATRLHFRGDTADYYHPRNSSLTEVLDRRQGLPILLSCVWILVGRAAGLSVDGIGMPGHFIARVGGDDGVLVDPFHQGETMAPETCRAIVGRLGGPYAQWRDEYLEPLPTGDIIERVLNNLVGAYTRLSDLVGAYRVLGFHAALRPEAAGARLRQAVVAERLGAVRLAAEHYQAIAEDFEGTVAAHQAEQRLADLGPAGFLN
jgi:regulator of sirC expression with transglutaminase-like and TPR domain